ncbi:MAG TPA: hypothetical protein VNJ12_00830 [Candidatus Dormibacteraeota bacterium]|nr:hypothetical protein [Candidatus Dormibacteraeota bacterium]
MRKVWRLVVRVIFWSYDRGSLPYDLMVIAILLFVLLTPRKWYRDQPRWNTRPVSGQIRLLDVDPAGQTELFRVDASLFARPQPAPKLEQASRALLSRSVSSLRGEAFQVVQIQPVRGAGGAVTAYDVRIKPTHPVTR